MNSKKNGEVQSLDYFGLFPKLKSRVEKILTPLIIISILVVFIDAVSSFDISVVYPNLALLKVICFILLLMTLVTIAVIMLVRSKNDCLQIVVELMNDISTPLLLIDKSGKIVMTSNYFSSAFNVDINNPEENNISRYIKNSKSKLTYWLSNPKSIYSEKFTLDGKYSSGYLNIMPRAYRKGSQTYFLVNIKFAKTFHEEVAKYTEFTDRYKMVMSSNRNVIWDYNFETGESYYNDSIYRLFGYTAEEIKENPDWWSSTIHPDDRDRVLKNLDHCIAENHLIWNDEYRIKCANGNYKAVTDTGLIQRKENGQPYKLLGFMTDITEQIELQTQLTEEQNLHKIELAKAISNAQEAERKNMSEELHDNVCQVLGGVKLFIDHCLVLKEKNEDLLRQSSGHLNDAITELRKMAHCLSPYFVEEFGLISGLTELIYFATNFRKATVNLDVSQFDEQILTSHKKLLIYRIAQEQMNNILKHAHATVINIQLRNIGDICYFTVQDNGKGMNLSEAKHGLGLKNIEHRVELLNGSVDFQTTVGQGFSMKIEFMAS